MVLDKNQTVEANVTGSSYEPKGQLLNLDDKKMDKNMFSSVREVCCLCNDASVVFDKVMIILK